MSDGPPEAICPFNFDAVFCHFDYGGDRPDDPNLAVLQFDWPLTAHWPLDNLYDGTQSQNPLIAQLQSLKRGIGQDVLVLCLVGVCSKI